jgi:hypothetical protein
MQDADCAGEHPVSSIENPEMPPQSKFDQLNKKW